MILLIGGAYQGKLDFAREAYSISEEDIFTCTGAEIDFSKKCIYHLEAFTYGCIRQGLDPEAWFAVHKEEWENSILICEDIFCGVVPLEAELRAWRQATGRLCQYLAGQAEQVSRIFCGLEQRLL